MPGLFTYNEYFAYFSSDLLSVFGRRDFYRKSILKFIDPRQQAFCAGVLLIDVEQWRTRQVHKEFEFWMRANARHKLYALGTNPVLLMTFYDQWEHLDRQWQMENLFDTNGKADGSDKINAFTGCDVGIMHWNGNRKPWTRDTYQLYGYDRWQHKDMIEALAPDGKWYMANILADWPGCVYPEKDLGICHRTIEWIFPRTVYPWASNVTYVRGKVYWQELWLQFAHHKCTHIP